MMVFYIRQIPRVFDFDSAFSCGIWHVKFHALIEILSWFFYALVIIRATPMHHITLWIKTNHIKMYQNIKKQIMYHSIPPCVWAGPEIKRHIPGQKCTYICDTWSVSISYDVIHDLFYDLWCVLWSVICDWSTSYPIWHDWCIRSGAHLLRYKGYLQEHRYR